MTDSRRLDAALLGLAGSMRTFTPGAALAARGRLPERVRPLAYGAAAIEYAYDVSPVALRRTRWPALGARTVVGTLAGARLAGPAGAAIGGVAACAGTFASYEARRRAGAATGVPDLALALAEDAIAIGLAFTAAGPRRRTR
jgi:hypothetical protein